MRSRVVWSPQPTPSGRKRIYRRRQQWLLIIGLVFIIIGIVGAIYSRPEWILFDIFLAGLLLIVVLLGYIFIQIGTGQPRFPKRTQWQSNRGLRGRRLINLIITFVISIVGTLALIHILPDTYGALAWHFLSVMGVVIAILRGDS